MEKRYYNMGTVGMYPKGAYDKNVTYRKLQIVTYKNNTYCSKQHGNIGHEPVGDDEWWQLIVDAQTAYDGATSATAAAKRANDSADQAEKINAEVQKAEDLRIANEQERTTAETARDMAEQARQGDENLRKTAEENRASAVAWAMATCWEVVALSLVAYVAVMQIAKSRWAWLAAELTGMTMVYAVCLCKLLI